MKVLGIETSCDETAVSVLDINKSNIRVLSNTISSQVKLHAEYGGVVPNLAAREHVKNIEHVFKVALKKSKTKIEDVDLIAVTRGPGLGPALLVGISFARTLAWKFDKPLIGVNHLEGHIVSNFLKKVGVISKFDLSGQEIRNSKFFPVLNLVVSGGHTELVLMSDHGEYKLVGETLDDAIGEAFDKVARLLGLGYPGGPIISKLAEKGNPDLYPLPSPMIHTKDFNFSYSGLKTAVLYLVRDLNKVSKGKKITLKIKQDIASSFQKSASEVIIRKTIRAAKEYGAKSIFLSGGVSANKYLREELGKQAKELGLNYSQPELEYTGDNAAMIALAGYFSSENKNPKELAWNSVEMDANLGF
jgi:N6-L-threonylcarbamoyladenine synthase